MTERLGPASGLLDHSSSQGDSPALGLYPTSPEPLPTNPRTVDYEHIPPEQVLDFLELTGESRALQASVRGSQWASINGGRMVVEIRNSLPFMQRHVQGGKVNIYDFDDCLMSATGWHKNEYELVAQDPRLRAEGATISVEEAKRLYDLAKITVPGFAEKEPRYTPLLNMLLLTRVAEAKKRPNISREQLETETATWLESIRTQVDGIGERALNAYHINPTIRRIFMENSPREFLYANFVDSVLGGSHKADLQIIATRGKIEGPLGQVYKVHSSGLMGKRMKGKGMDFVIYSNDIKAEALLAIIGLLNITEGRHVKIYDDNPTEIIPYLGVIKDLGAQHIEVVQVSHPDAKRKDIKVDATPTVVYRDGDTKLRHYSYLSLSAQE